MLIEENKSLAPLTTFGIGGPSRWFVEAASEDEIVEATAWARDRNAPLFVLGGGSNVLIADRGFDGLVLRVGLRGVKTQSEDVGKVEEKIFSVAAGEDWCAFVDRAVDEKCAGIECLAGIPGTVGGTPVQNVGAYGQEVSSSIERVKVFDLFERVFREFSAADCGFSYRRSRFNSTDRGRFIVTRVDYRLTLNGAPTLRYADLQKAFEKGSQPDLKEVAAAVKRIRQSKGMLLVDGDADCRSAGSFFKNPVVSEEQASRITSATGQTPPRFPAGDGFVKLPAAWLIEHAGFAKGYELGAAAISSRHTLALTNRGSANAADILSLAGQITAGVAARFGIHLEMEPVLIGY
jgi:UDP-N-acetylmuramate dehydrogenase